jgi:hypothetical protein
VAEIPIVSPLDCRDSVAVFFGETLIAENGAVIVVYESKPVFAAAFGTWTWFTVEFIGGESVSLKDLRPSTASS